MSDTKATAEATASEATAEATASEATAEATASVPVDFTLAGVNEDVSTKIDTPEDNEGRDIAALKIHPGWIEIEEYIKSRIEELSHFSMADLSVEEIGYRHALVEQIKTELENIINIVDANYEFKEEKRKS